ncbi:protein FAM111A-like isoform X3 [Etheostoma spectabile]|uniref:protein FAM111A-like isoform X3 n=1 Tax=Etheostoma spectabile TaxID=54343 RepID=UPI0013AF1939|nr:protein FAM111A-like isoform X3 [Etheostoma spectabile]
MPSRKKNPPKKQNTLDIASFFGTPGKTVSSRLSESAQPGGATGGATGGASGSDPGEGAKFSQPSGDAQSNLGGATGSQTRSQTRVKEENGVDPTGEHLHRITVKFSPTDSEKYTIDCYHPRTLLDVIKSSEIYEKKMKMHSDENIVITVGEARDSIVATHFPCTCVRSDESLIISGKKEKVEVTQDQFYKIHSRDMYSVFYIDTVGGQYTEQKKLFRNKPAKKLKYLWVYGEKGITVKEALERDGRFIEDLGDFTLSDNENPDLITECTQKVDKLHEKHFKICLPRISANDSSGLSSNSAQRSDSMPAVDEAQQRKIRAAMEKRGISVRAAIEKSGNNVNIEEIYETLRRQFPELKAFMESRFPGDSYQKAVNLKKENFGKIQQSFSEVHRITKLLKRGESVCKIDVEDVSQGTGFVLFGNFILTNAHLLNGCVEGQKLKKGIEMSFFFEDPESKEYYFKLAHRDIYCTQDEIDYVGENYNHKTKKHKKMKVPPGLLKSFGPMPQNGEACIIGHPAGGVKKMDPTFIIEKETRDQSHPSKDPFVVWSINQIIQDQNIENIMMGGKNADKVVAYNTFMYHGSSGSPVFDARGRVVGLHTAGFLYKQESVIELAQPLLTIFKDIVTMLKEHGKDELLETVKKEVKENSDLEEVFMSVVELKDEPADPEELLDYIEPMETD